LIALGAWFLFSRGHRNQNVGGTADYTRTQVGGDRAIPPANGIPNAVEGIGDDIARAAANGDYTHSFSLQGLSFDSAGNLASSARNKIQELGATMVASPSLKIKVTGYGASEEEGQSKANAIKTALVSTGISEDRVQTAGAAGSGAPSVNVVP
jgi:outer membrane protein OmpA-like peptidoglycan-associated protein